MSHSTERAWNGVVALDNAVARRVPQPRDHGITMVIDTGLGIRETSDLVEIQGSNIDHWKLAFGTSALMPLDLLRDKLKLIAGAGCLTYPGGTLLEAAIVQQHCRFFMERAIFLGFTAVEISEGTIRLPGDRRKRVIDCATDAGLIAVTEVGNKDVSRQPTAKEIAEQALQDLDWGASWVIIEGRESGCGIGIYDENCRIRNNMFEEIVTRVGPSVDKLIWEAPRKEQQVDLIKRLGPNISLGNVNVRDCLSLEAMRTGLRYETFAPLVERDVDEGNWDPSKIEHPEVKEVIGSE